MPKKTTTPDLTKFVKSEIKTLSSEETQILREKRREVKKFDNFLCSASMLSKVCNLDGTLSSSVTAKKELIKQFLKYNRGIEDVFDKKSKRRIKKGKYQEKQSIKMFRDLKKVWIDSNKTTKINDYFMAEADGVGSDFITEHKEAYELSTFLSESEKDLEKMYKIQTIVTAILWQVEKAFLVRTCQSLHPLLIEEEKQEAVRYFEFSMNAEEREKETLQLLEGVNKKFIYEDIPMKNRIKIIEFDLSQDGDLIHYNLIESVNQIREEFKNFLKIYN